MDVKVDSRIRIDWALLLPIRQYCTTNIANGIDSERRKLSHGLNLTANVFVVLKMGNATVR
jgi:hypothetical protein